MTLGRSIGTKTKPLYCSRPLPISNLVSNLVRIMTYNLSKLLIKNITRHDIFLCKYTHILLVSTLLKSHSFNKFSSFKINAEVCKLSVKY